MLVFYIQSLFFSDQLDQYQREYQRSIAKYDAETIKSLGMCFFSAIILNESVNQPKTNLQWLIVNTEVRQKYISES